MDTTTTTTTTLAPITQTAAERAPQAGDVIDMEFGIHREIERALILNVTNVFEDGAVSFAWWFHSNPHGVTWRGFMTADEEYTLVGREEHADLTVRSLLPD